MIRILVLDKLPHFFLLDLKKKYYIYEDYSSSKEEFQKELQNYHGIIIRSRIILDSNFIDKFKNLKFIARFGVGLENIDVNYCNKKGIEVFNSQEGNSQAVAEHTIGLIISLSKNIIKSNNDIKYNNLWQRELNRGFELKGKTLGIIGYGNIGKLVAKCISGFGVDVISFDIKKNYSDGYTREVGMEQIFLNSDIVSIHTPLTDLTYQMCDDKFFSKFNKNIIFINTARGKILNTKSLINKINEGKILGAGLDVLEYEKSSFENIEINEEIEFLKKLSNIILTPHIAGWSFESNEKMAKIILDKIKNVIKI